MLFRAGVFVFFAAFLSVLTTLFLLPTTSASAEDKLTWQFSEGNDPGNKGRMTARLSYAVPETDNAQVSGVCEARSSTGVNLVSLTLGADIGDLKENADVDVRFSGGGSEHVLEGSVHGRDIEVGITGVHLDVGINDDLWDLLTQKNSLDYLIPGYRAASLDLKDGHGAIKKFIAACRSYAEALSPKKSADASSSDSDMSEKEAFEAAKELNTLEGWEAFLTNYPNGFRADLARAYVKRLGNETPESPAPPPPPPPAQIASPPPPPPPPPAQVNTPPLSTVDLGPGSSRWQNLNRPIAMLQNRSFYAASVQGQGVELITFCLDPSMSQGNGYVLTGVIKESQPGIYPDFIGRINQGLANAAPLANGTMRQISITFSNGEQVFSATANPALVNGELAIGTLSQGFLANSRDLENFMAGNTVTFAAPPFSSTFQLSGSRDAICSVMDSCGAVVNGCPSSRNTVAPVSAPRPRCAGGSFYSKRANACICRKGRVLIDGVCKRRAKKCRKGFELVNGRCLRNEELDDRNLCGPGFTMVKGKCIHNNDLPKNKPKKPFAGSGGCKGGQIRLANGNCVCPKNMQYIGGSCVSLKQIQKNLQNIISDRRLKTEVSHITTLANGIKLYAFRYVWEDTMRVGVMAQDLLADPATSDAVTLTSAGFYTVDYGRLGLKMVTLEQWRQKGPAALARSAANPEARRPAAMAR